VVLQPFQKKDAELTARGEALLHHFLSTPSLILFDARKLSRIERERERETERKHYAFESSLYLVMAWTAALTLRIRILYVRYGAIVFWLQLRIP
jgi:hypothetical protein